jgi:cell division protein FtsW
MLLVGIGIVMIYSASAIRAQERFGDPTFFLKRQALWAALGVLAMLWAMTSDYRRLPRIAPLLFGAAVALLVLVLVPGLGVKVNGARRWLRLAGVSFQPSEFAKLALVIFLASLFARKGERAATFVDGCLPPLLLSGLVFALIALQPNFGTGMVIVLLCLTLCFVGGTRLRDLALAACAAAPALLAVLLSRPHARTRLLALFDPARVPDQARYQVVQSLYALGPGGLWGRGLGDSVQKLFYLPEPHTDFVFAIVGEEMGFLGTTLVIALFGIILWRGTRIALRAADPFGHHLAVGLTTIVVAQACINLAVVSGVFPTTGLPLPFISFGGSSLVVTMAAVGLLLSVSEVAGRGRAA